MITHAQLLKLDPKYFRSFEPEDLTDEQVAYRLATWLYDKEGWEPILRQKVKEQLPHNVYVEMLENFVDGNHDT